MNTQNPDNRIFGILALVLFVVGLLAPFVIDAFFGVQIASAFASISLGLSLIFGLIARHHKTGKVTLGGLTVLAIVATSTFAFVSAKRSAREEQMTTQQVGGQTIPPVLAEQPPERDK